MAQAAREAGYGITLDLLWDITGPASRSARAPAEPGRGGRRPRRGARRDAGGRGAPRPVRPAHRPRRVPRRRRPDRRGRPAGRRRRWRPVTCSSSATARIAHITGPADWPQAEARHRRVPRGAGPGRGPSPGPVVTGDWSPTRRVRGLPAHPRREPVHDSALRRERPDGDGGACAPWPRPGERARRRLASSGSTTSPRPRSPSRRSRRSARTSPRWVARRCASSSARSAARSCRRRLVPPRLVARAVDRRPPTRPPSLRRLTGHEMVERRLRHRDVSVNNVSAHITPSTATAGRRRRSRGMTRDDDRYVVGVDFGTLSGRALVVRVSDGAELGSAVHEYPHGVVDAVLPGSGRARSRRTGPCRCPSDYVEVLRTAVPAAVAAAGIDPADVIGIGTDFTACTMVPTLADGTPLCELPTSSRDEPARLRQAVEAPRRPGQADRINDLAARARRAGWPATAGVISSEWEFAKGLQLLEEAPRSTPRWSTGSRPPTGSSGSSPARYVRNACTAGYKGIRQDGAYPSPRLPRRAQPGLRAASSRTSSTTPIGELGDRRRPPDAPGPPAWTGLPEGIAGRRRQRRRPRHGPRGGGRRARPDGRHHGHLDLPRHELRRARRGAGHVRRRRRRHRHRACTATRPGSPASATSSAGSSRTRCPAPTPRPPAPPASACTSTSPTLAAEQPVGAHGLVALDW